MIEFPIPVMGFAAYSGTGKTTLLSKLIPLLKEKGYRIAIIKHTHHNIDIDKPGKDTYVLRKAGAEQTVIASRNLTAVIIEDPLETEEPTLEEALQNLQTESLDLVLVEGFKAAKFTKIELHRQGILTSQDKPYLFSNDENIIAIATDHNETFDNDSDQRLLASKNMEVLDINQIEEIADFIEHNILRKHLNKHS